MSTAKRFAWVSLLSVVLLTVAVPPTDAAGRGGHGGRGGHHGGFRHHGGGGVFIGVGPWWWPPYPYYYYPPPYYVYSPPPVVVQEPPVYVQQQPAVTGPPAPPAPPAQSQTIEAYWYYCPSAKGYYPSVETCPEPWVKIPPRTQ